MCVLVVSPKLSKRLAKKCVLAAPVTPIPHYSNYPKLASLRVGSTFVAHPRMGATRVEPADQATTTRPGPVRRSRWPAWCPAFCTFFVFGLVNKLLESVTKEGSDATALNAEVLTAKVVAMEAKLDEVVGLLKAMAKEKL